MKDKTRLPPITKMTLNSTYCGEMNEKEALNLLQYLDSAAVQPEGNQIAMGPCPLCSQVIEKGMVQDEAFIWEKGLAHAVLHHKAKPPEKFIKHVQTVMSLKSFFHVLEEGG